MSGIGAALGRFFSRGDAGLSVPAMDGVFKPNNRLETADRVLELADIDNLAAYGSALVASSGAALHQISTEGSVADCSVLESFPSPITFIAASDDRRLAVGTRGAGIRVGTPGSWASIDVPEDRAGCMTAAAFLPDGRLAVCIGSSDHSDADWKRDLMELGQSGSVALVDPSDASVTVLASGLAYPNGIVALGDGTLAVAESWRHRIQSISPDGSRSPDVRLDNLPAYPSRLSRAEDGVWIALFAPRRQLFEMVLREDGYRNEMIATIDPAQWIGPALRETTGPDQPLQQGSVRQMGVLKPWAPSRSYGLVVRCDDALRPLESWHSRADGRMHGVTSVSETGQGVFVSSRGSGTLLRLADTSNGEGA